MFATLINFLHLLILALVIQSMEECCLRCQNTHAQKKNQYSKEALMINNKTKNINKAKQSN